MVGHRLLEAAADDEVFLLEEDEDFRVEVEAFFVLSVVGSLTEDEDLLVDFFVLLGALLEDLLFDEEALDGTAEDDCTIVAA